MVFEVCLQLINIQWILYLYWTCDVLLLLYGIPTTFEWISPPRWILELFQYGKTRNGKVENRLVKLIEVPKSWFRHYYIFGICVSVFMVLLTVGCFVLGVDVPGKGTVNNIFLNTANKPTIDEYSVMMICMMMLIQHARRIYECQTISVYSKGTMNVLHYFLGFMLYSTVQLCAISDGPTLNYQFQHTGVSLLSLGENLLENWHKILGVVVFLWASYHHHQSHVILAQLRKDATGKTVLHTKHTIPYGGLFEYFSAPHFVCEILIYVAMGLVAMRSYAFWMGPVLFTCTNQLLMIHVTHKWYKQKFEDYPKRYMIIPYVL